MKEATRKKEEGEETRMEGQMQKEEEEKANGKS